jgi:hypothetical protein
MVIQRYITVAGGTKHIAAEAQAELLIAFTPTIVHEQGDADHRMAAGSVLWIRPNTNSDLRSAGTRAAHILAIRLLN